MADKIKEARVETPPEVPATHFSEISFPLCIALCKVSRTGGKDAAAVTNPLAVWRRVESLG